MNVGAKCPPVFQEQVDVIQLSDTESSLDQLEDPSVPSPKPVPPTIAIQISSPIVERRQRSGKSTDCTSDYGSDPLRESVISSDNPEEIVVKTFAGVFELVKDLGDSASSLSPVKADCDSMSISSTDTDELLLDKKEDSSDSDGESSDDEFDRREVFSSPIEEEILSTSPANNSVQVDEKLVQWAKDEFIPLSHSILDECSKDQPIVLSLQSHLRELSNNLTQLCSTILRKRSSRSCSVNSQGSLNEEEDHREVLLDGTCDHLSFIVRVLSPSAPAMRPLIGKLSYGFSDQIYQEIARSLQKIAWKVEGCVSYENPEKRFECHKLVFDEGRKEKVLKYLGITPPMVKQLNAKHLYRHSTAACLSYVKGSPSFEKIHKDLGKMSSYDPSTLHSVGSPTSLLPRLPGNSEEKDQGHCTDDPETTACSLHANDRGDDYFRPTDFKRCQTITLTVEEVNSLGLKSVRDAGKRDSEENLKDFQAFRSYSLSFFKRSPHLSRVPKSIKDKISKSIRRRESFGSLSQIRKQQKQLDSGSPDQHQRRESSPGSSTGSELKAPSMPNTRVPSYESLTSTINMDHYERETSVLSTVSERPHKRRFHIPSRLKRLSTQDKQSGNTSETMRAPRERPTSKSIFNIFNKRHSQHFFGDSSQGESPDSPPGNDIQSPSSPSLLVASTPLSPLLQDATIPQELVSVAVNPVAQRKSKKGSSLTRDDGHTWFQVAVKSSVKEGDLEEQPVFKQYQHVADLSQQLYDVLPKGTKPLERSPRKLSAKKQKHKMESFLSRVLYDAHLRSHPAVLGFLQPNDQGPKSMLEVLQAQDWELLATFYGPDNSEGIHGAMHGVMHFEGVNSLHPNSVASSSSTLKKMRSLSFRKKSFSTHRHEEDFVQTRVIREGDRDVLIFQFEGRQNKVVAGTFDKLVKQLAGEEKPDSYYVTTFLYGLRHFSTPYEVAVKLCKRFTMEVPPDASETERSYAAKWREIIQQRILDVLYQWMQKCWPDFERNPGVVEIVQSLLEPLLIHENINFQFQADSMLKLISERAPTLSTSEGADSLEDESMKPSTGSEETPPRSPALLPIGSHPEDPLPWKELLEASSHSIAKQLTIIELECLQAIDQFEVALHIWEKKSQVLKYRKNLDAYIKRFNEVSFWVGTVICDISTYKERGMMIEKFIEVAKHCYELKNYNTMTAILSGLSYSAVKRLKKSWMFVRDKTISLFTKYESIMDPANNSNRYRSVLAKVGKKDPCVPFFGVFLKDFVFLNDGPPKILSNGLINFAKLRAIIMKIEELRRYQMSKYNLSSDHNLYRLCKDLRILSEGELYDKSLEIEPREVPIHKAFSSGTVERL